MIRERDTNGVCRRSKKPGGNNRVEVTLPQPIHEQCIERELTNSQIGGMKDVTKMP